MKMRLRLLALSILLVGLCITVFAAGTTATVSWSPPTAYVDGTPLAGSGIDHYTVSWSRVVGGLALGSLDVKSPATSTTVPVLCGTMQFTVTVTTNGTATYANTTSAPTAPVAYVSGVSCAPNPPLAPAVH